MITLKVQMKSGFVSEIQVMQLLEIDGKEYREQSNPEDEYAERLAFLEGRIVAIENIFTRLEDAEPATITEVKDDQ